MIIDWYQNKTDSEIGGMQLSNKYWIEALEKAGLQVETERHRIDRWLIASNYPIYPSVRARSKIIALAHTSIVGKRTLEYYKNCHLVIAMSPRSAEMLKSHGINAIAHAPYIPLSFRFKRIKTRGSLFVGRIDKNKGIEETLDYINQNEIHTDFYGPIYDPYFHLIRQHKFAHYKGVAEYHQLPVLYNSYENFIWRLPRYGSYGRTLIEALLCGCELDVNDENFGVFSWDIDFDSEIAVRNFLEDELDKFVITVKSCL